MRHFFKPIQGIINCTEKTTGISPLEVLAGYKGRNIAEAKILNVVHDERIDLVQVRNEASKHITSDQKLQKKRFDKARAKARTYNDGEVVMILITSQATGSSRKLAPTFKGLFKVTKVLFSDRYEVEDLWENMKRWKTVVAVDKMKPWVLLRGELAKANEYLMTKVI